MNSAKNSADKIPRLKCRGKTKIPRKTVGPTNYIGPRSFGARGYRSAIQESLRSTDLHVYQNISMTVRVWGCRVTPVLYCNKRIL